MKSAWISLAAVCALVIVVYAYVVQPGVLELGSANAADAYYNLLVQGFRAGQLGVKQEAPPGLAKLTDPYDLSTYGRTSGLLDLSYYKGRLYLYFGVVPALILFWPFTALTGHNLFHWQAVVIFCAIGFLASVGLLCALWRRYFADVGLGVAVACALALGLAAGVPVLLSQSDVWEVPISCGYMLTMLALGAVWCALHEPGRKARWLVAASAAYGLAVASRPSLLFGAIMLLVPVAQARRDGRGMGAPLLAAVIPITLIGLGLMWYNAQRFDNPFEFGLHYQLREKRWMARQFFGLHHLWFNFRAYFLEPSRWTAHSPFVQGCVMPSGPPDHGNVEHPFGVVTNIPLVWLALAAPLAWRDRGDQAGSILRWFVMAVALLFGMEALTLGFYYCTASRFEVEFLPPLLLVAVVGIFGLERVLADQPARRRLVRCGWGLLLACSVTFNLLAGVKYYAEVQTDVGNRLLQAGKVSEALAHYQQARRIDPDSAEVQNNLGTGLAQADRIEEAIAHFEQALRINPDYGEAHNNIGIVLAHAGRIEEAITHFEQAQRINPNDADAYCNLGIALARTGKTEEAIPQFERALRLKPDFTQAHYNLGNALARVGRVPEAIAHYQQALRIQPDFTKAQIALARLQAGQSSH